MNLGRTIEFGAGGYTQTRNILEHVNATLESIVLVDPLIYSYKAMTGCSFSDGSLVVNGTSYRTTLSNSTVESFFAGSSPVSFDTVIVMNVVVYSINALDFLTSIYNAVKPGGLLIFHDRYFENIERSSRCKTSGFLINVVQVSQLVIDHFMSKFDTKHPVFFNANQTLDQQRRSLEWCLKLESERGYFVVLRKPMATDG